jgi:hypothetical protein
MSTRQWPTFKEPNATKVQPIPGEVETAVATAKFGTVAKGRCQVDLWQKLPFGPEDNTEAVRY